MKKAPLLIAVGITAVLLLILYIIGHGSIYALDDNNGVDKPFFTAVLKNMKDGIYPWDVLDEEKRQAAILEAEAVKAKEERMFSKQNDAVADEEPVMTSTPAPQPEKTATPKPSAPPKASPTPEPTPFYEVRYAPVRETTYDEYISHISADIYGDKGVLHAAEYPFKKVDITYMDDALFIGDSRTVGLKKYTDIKEHADFLCVTSMTVYKALSSDFDGQGSIEKRVKNNKYGKVYIMLGVNELGTGTTEDFLKSYTELVDRILELSPETKVIIQGIMNIDKAQSTSDKIFNNENILARNHAIATLADNERVFYLDVNPLVCDEDGFLREDLRGDHLHLLGKSNEIWREFLLSHGV